MKKKLMCFFAVTALSACFSANFVSAADVHVTYVTPKGVSVVAAPQGSNMTWMGPTDINIDGYAFCGWDVSLSNVNQDLVANAVYLPMNGSSETSAICQTWQTLPSGVLSYTNVTSATLPKETHELKSAPTPMPFPRSLTAEETIRLNPVGVPGQTCVVKWYNGSTGELWKADVVSYGVTLPQPENPCITGLEFTGWNGSWTNITEDRNIVGSFYKCYKVEYVCEVCNEPVKDVIIREGDDVPRFDTQMHDHTDEDHRFKGWYDPVLQSDGYRIVVLGNYDHLNREKDYGIDKDDIDKIDEKSIYNREPDDD